MFPSAKSPVHYLCNPLLGPCTGAQLIQVLRLDTNQAPVTASLSLTLLISVLTAEVSSFGFYGKITFRVWCSLVLSVFCALVLFLSFFVFTMKDFLLLLAIPGIPATHASHLFRPRGLVCSSVAECCLKCMRPCI